MSDHLRETERTRKVLQSLSEERAVSLIRVDDALCDGDICPFMSEGDPIYVDQSHLSPTGALMLVPALKDIAGE